MSPKALQSTSATAGLFLAASTLGACAVLAPPVDTVSMLRPIETAAVNDVAQIRPRAEAGDAQAQLALWVSLSRGLNGGERTPAEAALWRSRALASRGYTPITQYTAAFNGQPSLINIINVPRYGAPPVQVELIERCLAWLDGLAPDPSLCGEGEYGQRMRVLWTR